MILKSTAWPCHFTVPEKGGFKGWLGLARRCRTSRGLPPDRPIRFKDKMAGRRHVPAPPLAVLQEMQIVRGCDPKRNVLVYMVYSDRLIEGSPKNSTPRAIMPWGAADATVQKCSEFIQ